MILSTLYFFESDTDQRSQNSDSDDTMSQVSTGVSNQDISAEDFALLNELWTTIENDPTSIHPRKLLVEQLTTCGWIEAAVDAAKEVLEIDPTDKHMSDFIQQHQPVASGPSITYNKPVLKKGPPRFKPKRAERVPVPKTEAERSQLEQRLIDAISALQERALVLSRDIRTVTEFRRMRGESISKDHELEKLHSLANGQLGTFGSKTSQSARAVARTIEAEEDSQKALDYAISDLEEILGRLQSSETPSTDDSVRETLVKRCRIIATSLSADKQDHPSLALMHLEHEKLGREYHNKETMFGDEIKEIPRADFFQSEDGYAWSMDELAQAITSNGGVMRNPLSKEMFSTTDIRRIIQYPTGKQLAAMLLEQSKMSQGVRPATIDHLSNLADTFLTDMEEDQKASRLALGESHEISMMLFNHLLIFFLDEFVAYLATLPQSEQDALDKLRVPAQDSHTGQEFDCTIGDAVRDAKANKICVHKAGDLLKQAANYLRKVNTK
jgi:hypothetical protein